MIDRNSQFMAILTNVGAAKLANANALGIPWNLTALGVGDANGTDPIPSATQTNLINEQRRAPLNQLRVDPVNSAVIIAEQVIPADVGGWWIREIGLYDSDGDLVAVSNCAPSFKPALDQGSGRTQIVRMNFIVSGTNNIVLKIDPAVVLATREYVDLAITEAVNRQDFKHSVLVATTAAIALNGLQTVDGVAVVEGNRVLVKNQAQGKANGIYLVSNGAWARSQDADASVEVTPGLFVHVEKGTDNGDSVWQLVTDAPIVLGTTALLFEMVVGRTGVSAGAYTKITVDRFGRVVAGINPTTLAGYGITDAFTKEVIASMFEQGDASIADLKSRVNQLDGALTNQLKKIVDVKAFRVINVTYTNTTGRLMYVNVALSSTAINQTAVINVDTFSFVGSSFPSANFSISVSAPVPAGSTYKIPPGSYTIYSWTEMSS